MFSVPEFLDRAKKGAGNVTDYRLAKLLGVTSAAVSTWRNGVRAPDERAVLKLCEFSGDDPEHVVACLQSMRAANDDAADLWRRIADRLKQGGAASLAFVVVAVGVLYSGVFHLGDAAAASLPSAYYVECAMAFAALRLLWRVAPWFVRHLQPAAQPNSSQTPAPAIA